MADLVKPGDLERIKAPIDVIGMNYYSRFTVRHDPNLMFGMGWGKPHADRFTAYGWPVEPDGIAEMLLELKQLYGNPPVLITENGAAYADAPDAAGKVDDEDRIAFLRDHVLAVQRAKTAGCNVRGYMPWSLLDNFEWQMGYTMRFGLVRVEFTNLNRIEKASYRWYRDLVRGV
jgi:beta-glucosidase